MKSSSNHGQLKKTKQKTIENKNKKKKTDLLLKIC